MVASSVGSWAVLALLAPESAVEVFWGMLGPLAIACGFWMLADRAYRRDPASLTQVMIASFGGKIVFFGAYVAAMLRGLSLRPVPFVASFTGYFIALHVTEALCLRRLFAGAARQ